MLKFLSLFSGIGGLDLGLEQSGMTCIGQVEKEKFARKVLKKHWLDVPRWTDVCKFNGSMLDEKPNVIAGGFPCQDISNAGLMQGLSGNRSGLWFEYLRIICELRPQYVVVENVAALLIRGMDTVLSGLANSGYDAEWSLLSAAAMGAPHERKRLFIVAYPFENRRQYVFTKNKLPSPKTTFAWHTFRTTKLKVWVETNAKLYRNDDGVPNRVDRIGSLGNAVPPPMGLYIGNHIIADFQKRQAKSNA